MKQNDWQAWKADEQTKEKSDTIYGPGPSVMVESDLDTVFIYAAQGRL